jgi:hypothetical protein
MCNHPAQDANISLIAYKSTRSADGSGAVVGILCIFGVATVVRRSEPFLLQGRP